MVWFKVCSKCIYLSNVSFFSGLYHIQMDLLKWPISFVGLHHSIAQISYIDGTKYRGNHHTIYMCGGGGTRTVCPSGIIYTLTFLVFWLVSYIRCSYFEASIAFYIPYFFALIQSSLTHQRLFMDTFLVHTSNLTYKGVIVYHLCVVSIYWSNVLPPSTGLFVSPDLLSGLWEPSLGLMPKLFQRSEARKTTKCLLYCWSTAQFFSYVNDVISRRMWWILRRQRQGGKPPIWL